MTAPRTLPGVTSLPVILGVLGMVLGPSGIIWATLNWRTDDTGKRIQQTGEIVLMLQGVITTLERQLAECEKRLAESESETAVAEAALHECREACRLKQRELDDVRSQLRALQTGAS